MGDLEINPTEWSQPTADASCWMIEVSSEARLALSQLPLAQQQYCLGLVAPAAHLSAQHPLHLHHHHHRQCPDRLTMPQQQLDSTLSLALKVCHCWEALLSPIHLTMLQSPAGKAVSQQEVHQQEVSHQDLLWILPDKDLMQQQLTLACKKKALLCKSVI